MLLDKKIKIFISNKGIQKKYVNKGYECQVKEKLEIDILDLPINSHSVVSCECDYCGAIVERKYQVYNRNTKNNSENFCCENVECIKQKRTYRNQEKYGVDNVFQISEVKEKIKETNIEKYGCENPQQNKEIKEKTETTNLSKYGFKNVFQNEEIKEKSKQTCLEKYGVEYPQQSKEIRKKQTNYRKSKSEIIIYDFIKSYYDGEIITISKKMIGEELDIYLPELNLAFEFNGLYWHNEITKNRNYHKNKSDLCQEKGIQLIHIWEDDWEFKQEIVKSMILNKLGKTTNKIYARKTIVKEVIDNKLVRNFLDENHIQGFVGSSIKLGLFYENKLVSLMCFKNSVNETELVRFCNKLNTSLIGGASKLFKHFIKSYDYKSIKTFADRSYSNGDLYYKLGFEFDKEINVDYSYTINHNKLRSHKFNFRKYKLVKQGFDPNKSEHEIMLERKIYRIWDAGKFRFIFRNL